LAVYFHENLRRPTPISTLSKKFKAPQKRPKLRETNGGFHKSLICHLVVSWYWGYTPVNSHSNGTSTIFDRKYTFQGSIFQPAMLVYPESIYPLRFPCFLCQFPGCHAVQVFNSSALLNLAKESMDVTLDMLPLTIGRVAFGP